MTGKLIGRAKMKNRAVRGESKKMKAKDPENDADGGDDSDIG